MPREEQLRHAANLLDKGQPGTQPSPEDAKVRFLAAYELLSRVLDRARPVAEQLAREPL